MGVGSGDVEAQYPKQLVMATIIYGSKVLTQDIVFHILIKHSITESMSGHISWWADYARSECARSTDPTAASVDAG